MALSIASALVNVGSLIEDIGRRENEDIIDLIDAERPQDNKLKARIRRAADDLAELLEEAIGAAADADNESDAEEDDES